MDKKAQCEQQLLALINEAGPLALEGIRASLRFNKDDRAHLAPVVIYCSIVELFYSCMALIKERQWTALPMVIRSMTESYADLKGCAADDTYWRRMHATYLNEMVRLGNNVNPDHPFLAGVHAGGDAEKQYKEYKVELDEAKSKDIRPLQTWERFKAADMMPEYQSIYWHLCMESHNNLKALEDRHLEYEGDKFNIVVFRQDLDRLHYLDAMLVTLIGSSATIHGMFNPDAVTRFDEIAKRFADIRAGYFQP